jgi:hypothetical protein
MFTTGMMMIKVIETVEREMIVRGKNAVAERVIRTMMTIMIMITTMMIAIKMVVIEAVTVEVVVGEEGVVGERVTGTIIMITTGMMTIKMEMIETITGEVIVGENLVEENAARIVGYVFCICYNNIIFMPNKHRKCTALFYRKSALPI